MNNETKVSWLAALFSNWGCKEAVAKALAGAIIGALAALGLTSCTVYYANKANTEGVEYRMEFTPGADLIGTIVDAVVHTEPETK